MEDSITPNRRRVFLVLTLIVVAVLAANLQAQRRPRPQPSRPASSRVDYSRFLHTTKEHKGACTTCHQAPTSNWKKVRGFPDIADFPDHDACVRCHRAQFFKGAQPLICTNCHSRVSPKDDARFPFRNPARPRQFKIEFPHDKHQDVIAMLRSLSPTLARNQSKPTRVVSFAHSNQERIDYNNCTICHATNSRQPAAPAQGWTDGFIPSAASFKTAPTVHAACFNCHWKNQPPTKDNCGDCHKLDVPGAPPAAPVRISLKFNHEGGGGQHLAECTTCHINITKSASVRGLKPDVPITGCTECHNKSGLRQDLNKELAALDQNRDFVCTYCHTSDVGRRDAKPSHYLVAEQIPRLRKDIK
jgi:Class III cytochrome C family